MRLLSNLPTFPARRLLRRAAVAAVLLSATGAALPGSPDFVTPERILSGFRGGLPFRQPRGVALDMERGEVIVANTGDHRVEIFSLQGRALDRFVHRVRRADGSWADGLPRAVAVDAAGRILVADNLASYVDVVDRGGRSLGRIDLPGANTGPAGAVHVARSGDIWIGGPPRDDRVYRFDPEGSPLTSWGAPGSAPGQLHSITAIAALPDGDLVVVCAQTELAIQIFSPDGAYRRGWGRHDLGPGNFSLPSGVAVTDDGRIWVSDELRQIVQVFTASGDYLGGFGGKGLSPGSFHYPSALAGDGRRHLAVAEREAGRVQLLTVIEGGDVTGSKDQQTESGALKHSMETRAESSTRRGETP